MSLSQKNSPYHHWEFLNIHNGDYLRIVPERGGLITEWRCNGRDILYFDLERFLQKGKSIRGGIPILFPICGNLPNNTLQLDKGNFTLNQHGFARDNAWSIKSHNDQNSMLLSFSDTEITHLFYPYSFLIEIKVTLGLGAISFEIFIMNTSEEDMPFSFGLHPYFNVTNITKTKIVGLLPNCTNHLNMQEVKTSDQLQSLSDGIDLVCGPSDSVSLLDLVTGMKLNLEHQAPMDLTVVWTDPPRNMVCLEPWTSPRGSLVSGERRLLLEPGATQNLRCRISVS